MDASGLFGEVAVNAAAATNAVKAQIEAELLGPPQTFSSDEHHSESRSSTSLLPLDIPYSSNLSRPQSASRRVAFKNCATTSRYNLEVEPSINSQADKEIGSPSSPSSTLQLGLTATIPIFPRSNESPPPPIQSGNTSATEAGLPSPNAINQSSTGHTPLHSQILLSPEKLPISASSLAPKPTSGVLRSTLPSMDNLNKVSIPHTWGLTETNTTNTPIETSLLKADKIINQKTTFAVAITKAAFFDKVIDSIKEGADEPLAISCAANANANAALSLQTGGNSINLKTRLQHMSAHILESQDDSLGPKRLNLTHVPVNLKKKKPWAVPHSSSQANRTHEAEISIIPLCVDNPSSAADQTMGKMRLLIEKMNALSNTMHINPSHDFVDEPQEFRMAKGIHQKIHLLMDNYDTLFDSRHDTKLVEDARKNLKLEYEKKIKHDICNSRIFQLSKECELVKSENTKLSLTCNKQTIELQELRLFKSNTQTEHAIMLKELAMRRMKQRVLRRQLRTALERVAGLDTTTSDNQKGDSDIPGGITKNIDSAQIDNSYMRSTVSYTSKPSKETPRGLDEQSTTTDSRPLSGRSHISRKKTERDPGKIDDEDTDIEVNDADFQKWQELQLQKPQWNKSTTTHLLAQKTPQSVMYIPTQENIDKLGYTVSESDPDQTSFQTYRAQRDAVLHRIHSPCRKQRRKLQDVIFAERESKRKSKKKATSQHSTIKKLIDLLKSCLATPVFCCPEVQGKSEPLSMKITSNEISACQTIISQVLKGLESLSLMPGASVEEFDGDNTSDKDVLFLDKKAEDIASNVVHREKASQPISTAIIRTHDPGISDREAAIQPEDMSRHIVHNAADIYKCTQNHTARRPIKNDMCLTDTDANNIVLESPHPRLEFHDIKSWVRQIHQKRPFSADAFKRKTISTTNDLLNAEIDRTGHQSAVSSLHIYPSKPAPSPVSFPMPDMPEKEEKNRHRIDLTHSARLHTRNTAAQLPAIATLSSRCQRPTSAPAWSKFASKPAQGKCQQYSLVGYAAEVNHKQPTLQ
ncbi:hypothetical protein BASA50_000012 [Batrachochytrium salamandrivorans]|uniref:Uncharacterized protein n=1 Tax=Batrachochytrium salamandrivorans TaxID=1357716 RepID=A0ABQ8EUS0_9FUNG|nr:hypothetical protein BASA50_000012 [Batrachochytrium salamandrivorans]